jgi:glycerol transport system ATP-binding protein
MGFSITNVDKRVDNEIHLQGINLELQSGSQNIILGRTLAGKTTLLRIMAGLDRPTTGQILENGLDVTGITVRKRSVAMVYQQFVNYPSLSIRDNIASALKIAGKPGEEIAGRVQEAARMLHLESMLDRLPQELSGGQQQRTAIARALVKDAQLLLLDEPLVNLDYKLREELRAELQAIFRRRDSIVVYTTTEPTEALMLGGNIVVMHEGRILQTGQTEEVYRAPVSVQVAEIFSDPPMNTLPAFARDGRLAIAHQASAPLDGHLRDLPPGRYILGVRPHHFYLTRRHERDIELPGNLELTEINGSETFIHVSHGELNLVAQEKGVQQHALGSRVSMFVRPRTFYIFNADGKLVRKPNFQEA